MSGPAAPNAPLPGRAAVTRARRACDVPWLPHDLTYARPYPCGWRCDRHSPWALAKQPEPEPGPGWPSRRPPITDQT